MSNYSEEQFDDQEDVSPILTDGSPSPMHPISGYSKTGTIEKGGLFQQQHVIDEDENIEYPADSDEKLYLR